MSVQFHVSFFYRNVSCYKAKLNNRAHSSWANRSGSVSCKRSSSQNIIKQNPINEPKKMNASKQKMDELCSFFLRVVTRFQHQVRLENGDRWVPHHVS